MTTVTVIQGTYDALNNNYQPVNGDVWSDLTSWASWLNWNSDPGDVEIQLDDDLGIVDVKTPTISMTYAGEISIILKISETGVFSGEETTITFAVGTTYAVPAGRYYRWLITATAGTTGLIPEINNFRTQYFTEVFTETKRSIVTSTLSGTTAARVVPTNFGTIYNVLITAHDTATWVDRAYAVPDGWAVTTITPVAGIVSKAPLTIVLKDLFGVPVDGICDITVTGAPKITITSTGVERI
jgi:hypothetical protein